MLFLYLIEENASPVQLVSFFFFFSFFISSLCTRAFSERGKNVVAVIDAHSACLSVWDKWCAYLFSFFFSFSIVSFSTFLDCERFIQRQLLCVRYCFALGDSVPFFSPFA